MEDIIHKARNEWITDGCIATDTYCALTNAGHDPEFLIEKFSQGEIE